MPTSFTDQFYTFDPANPPAVGSSVGFVIYTLVDQNDDGDVDRFNNDRVNGSDVQQSYPGDTVTISVPGVGNVTYTGITFYLANGQRVFTPTDGQLLQNGTFVSSTFVNGQGPLLTADLAPFCLAAGTRVAVPGGERPVESLRPGDEVLTLDNGPLPLRWTGRRTVRGEGALAPVRICAGVLGNRRELIVSPQHRMLISGWQSELGFGEPEVLVAAKHLTHWAGVERISVPEVDYVHLLFDDHQIILADGAPSESFHPGSLVLDTDRAALAEVTSIFPELADPEARTRFPAARRVLTGREAMALLPPDQPSGRAGSGQPPERRA